MPELPSNEKEFRGLLADEEIPFRQRLDARQQAGNRRRGSPSRTNISS